MARPTQLALRLPTWGGRRRGAGRKATRIRPARPHRAREEFRPYEPLHVTVRVAAHVWNLRSQRSFSVIGGALRGVRERPDFRVVHFSVQGNHLHMIAEADGPASFASAMRALSIRLARRLNTMMARRGRVLEDRYHVRVLRSPREVENAIRYVVGNYASHARRRGERVSPAWRDPYSSAAQSGPAAIQGSLWPEPIVGEARTWLLRRAREVPAEPKATAAGQ